MEIDTIGTYNTYKATIAEICKARGACTFCLSPSQLPHLAHDFVCCASVDLAISATLHYKGQALQAHGTLSHSQLLTSCATRT